MTARLISAPACLSVVELDALIEAVAPRPDPSRDWLVGTRQQMRRLSRLTRLGGLVSNNKKQGGLK